MHKEGSGGKQQTYMTYFINWWTVDDQDFISTMHDSRPFSSFPVSSVWFVVLCDWQLLFRNRILFEFLL